LAIKVGRRVCCPLPCRAPPRAPSSPDPAPREAYNLVLAEIPKSVRHLAGFGDERVEAQRCTLRHREPHAPLLSKIFFLLFVSPMFPSKCREFSPASPEHGASYS